MAIALETAVVRPFFIVSSFQENNICTDYCACLGMLFLWWVIRLLVWDTLLCNNDALTGIFTALFAVTLWNFFSKSTSQSSLQVMTLGLMYALAVIVSRATTRMSTTTDIWDIFSIWLLAFTVR